MIQPQVSGYYHTSLENITYCWQTYQPRDTAFKRELRHKFNCWQKVQTKRYCILTPKSEVLTNRSISPVKRQNTTMATTPNYDSSQYNTTQKRLGHGMKQFTRNLFPQPIPNGFKDISCWLGHNGSLRGVIILPGASSGK